MHPILVFLIVVGGLGGSVVTGSIIAFLLDLHKTGKRIDEDNDGWDM